VANRPGTFTGKDDPRRNSGGVPPEVRELRALLVGDAKAIHDALMAAVKEGSVPAIIYAHTQLLGKPKERVEIEGAGLGAGLVGLTREELLQIARLGEK